MRNKSRRKSRSNESHSYQILEPRQLLAAVPIISEFLASNGGSLLDEDGDSSDWIELYNAGDQAMSLSGWHLTDNATNLSQWTFPAVTLNSNEYLVVFASNKDRADADGTQLHTNFKLSAGGDYLALVSPDASSIAFEYAPQYPAQLVDVSYGAVLNNPNVMGYFNPPTPGQANQQSIVAEVVGFSHSNPTFTGSFQLTLSGASAGQTIRYTLDGSVPSSSSSLYSGPITVNQTIQIRALIQQSGKSDGAVRTANFSRLGADVQAFNSQLPILLIENFGGGSVPAKGWNQTGEGIHQVPRQSSTVSIFSNGTGTASLTGGTDLVSRAGIRERGAYSTTFPEPQYSLEIWDESDADRDADVFGMASESDWILYAANPALDQTLMNNQFMFALARQMSLWAPEVQLVEAFLNTDGGDVTMSDYVGLYVWTEKVKRDPGRLDFQPFNDDGTEGGFLLSINRMDAIPEDQPNATQPNFHTAGPNGVQQTPPDSFGIGDDIPRQYNAFLNYEHPNGYEINATQRQSIGNWFQEMEDVLYGRKSGVTWNDPINGYAKYIDVDNFIDYFILNNLSKNSDGLLLSMWIYNEDPNNGGKLKFGPPWDHDLGSFEGSATSGLEQRSDRLWYARLFQDPGFVIQYQDRWHMWRESVLSDASMNAVFDDYKSEIGDAAFIRDGVSNIDSRHNQAKNWLSQRAAAIDAKFGAPPQFNRDGGEVANGFSLTMTSLLAGNIYYTTDGSDPSLPNGSINPNALLFDGASETDQLIDTGLNWRYLDDGSNQQSAWRNAAFDDSGWAQGNAQLGYGDGDETTTVSYGSDSSNKYVTTYFRRTFDVVDPFAYTNLTLRLLRDDGASVYINGKEVVRSNLPGTLGDNAINFSTLAASTVSGNEESTLFLSYAIDPADLVAGLNTIAVEVHQIVRNSSDLSFDLELIGQKASGAALTLNESQTISARVRNGTSWGGLKRADFFVGSEMADAGNLRITEFNYHPASPSAGEIAAGFNDSDQFEFIEFLNTLAQPIDLKGVSFSDGVELEFTDFLELGPGERAVVVRDTAAFTARYGAGIRILGQWTGGLNNDGEQLALQDSSGGEIMTVTYNDVAPWYPAADGTGPTLELIDPVGTPANELGEYYSWRASAAQGGTPGAASTGVFIPRVANTIRDGGSLIRPDLWTTYSVVFNQDVNVNANSLVVTNSTSGDSQVNLAGIGFSYDDTTFTATWNLNALATPLAAAFYSVRLTAASVTGVNGGLVLDGDGNGSAGGDYLQSVYKAIPGDANLDGDVDIFQLANVNGQFKNVGDLAILKSNLGLTTNIGWSSGDFNADGDVDVFDFRLGVGNVGDLAVLLSNLGRDVRPPMGAANLRVLADDSNGLDSNIDLAVAIFEQNNSVPFSVLAPVIAPENNATESSAAIEIPALQTRSEQTSESNPNRNLIWTPAVFAEEARNARDENTRFIPPLSASESMVPQQLSGAISTPTESSSLIPSLLSDLNGDGSVDGTNVQSGISATDRLRDAHFIDLSADTFWWE